MTTSPSDYVTNRQIAEEIGTVFIGMTADQTIRYFTIGMEQVALNLGLGLDGVDRVIEVGELYSRYPYLMRFVEGLENASLALASEPPAPASEGYVYLLQDPVTKLYKIGRSASPDERLKAINSNFPPGRALIKMVASAKVEDPERVENYLHRAYLDVNVEREWFELTDTHVQAIKEYFKYKQI